MNAGMTLGVWLSPAEPVVVHAKLAEYEDRRQALPA